MRAKEAELGRPLSGCSRLLVGDVGSLNLLELECLQSLPYYFSVDLNNNVCHTHREIKIKATMGCNSHLSDWQRSKSLITCVGDVVRRKYFHTQAQLLWRTIDLSKFKIYLLFDSVIPLTSVSTSCITVPTKWQKCSYSLPNCNSEREEFKHPSG